MVAGPSIFHRRITARAVPALLPPFALALLVAHLFAAQTSVTRVPREQALAKINEHIGRIDLAEREMNTRYDLKTAPGTLTKAFQDKGVKSRAVLDYATAWGQNAVFPAWQNAKPYYAYHRQALVESADAISRNAAKTVPIEDLAYLDLGMNAWLQHEKTVEKLMQQFVDARAAAASILDQKQSVVAEKEKQPYSAHGPYDQKIAALEAQAQQQIARGAEPAKTLKEIGDNLRLFSPITANSRLDPGAPLALRGATPGKTAPRPTAAPEKRECEETKIENKTALALTPLREPPAIPDSAPTPRSPGPRKGK